jgi:molecular chaperone DnaK
MAIIGIDLGTSNSAAAVLRGGRPVIIPSADVNNGCIFLNSRVISSSAV